MQRKATVDRTEKVECIRLEFPQKKEILAALAQKAQDLQPGIQFFVIHIGRLIKGQRNRLSPRLAQPRFLMGRVAVSDPVCAVLAAVSGQPEKLRSNTRFLGRRGGNPCILSFFGNTFQKLISLL